MGKSSNISTGQTNANYSYTGFTPPSLTSRGFTRHEHLDDVGLINMNGRTYDPILGRMLSPDPNIAGGSQGLNRYSYVLNNPLKYTDPSGYSYKPIYWSKGGGGANWSIMGYFTGGYVGGITSSDYWGRNSTGYSVADAIPTVNQAFYWQKAYNNGETNTTYSEFMSNGFVFTRITVDDIIIGKFENGKEFIYSEASNEGGSNNGIPGLPQSQDLNNIYDIALTNIEIIRPGTGRTMSFRTPWVIQQPKGRPNYRANVAWRGIQVNLLEVNATMMKTTDGFAILNGTQTRDQDLGYFRINWQSGSGTITRYYSFQRYYVFGDGSELLIAAP